MMEPSTLLGQWGKPRFSEGLWYSLKGMDFGRLFFFVVVVVVAAFFQYLKGTSLLRRNNNFNSTARLWSQVGPSCKSGMTIWSFGPFVFLFVFQLKSGSTPQKWHVFDTQNKKQGQLTKGLRVKEHPLSCFSDGQPQWFRKKSDILRHSLSWWYIASFRLFCHPKRLNLQLTVCYKMVMPQKIRASFPTTNKPSFCEIQPFFLVWGILHLRFQWDRVLGRPVESWRDIDFAVSFSLSLDDTKTSWTCTRFDMEHCVNGEFRKDKRRRM